MTHLLNIAILITLVCIFVMYYHMTETKNIDKPVYSHDIVYSPKLDVVKDEDYLDNIPIFIINLKDRPERKKEMQEELDRHDMKGKFIIAYDGRNLDLNVLKENNFFTEKDDIRPLRRGEIGCYFSHIKCWELILESGKPYGMVLEDDVIFDSKFRTKFNDIFENVKDLDWDIISLGRSCKTGWFDNDCLDGTIIYKNAFRPTIMGYGAFAYIIKTSTIEKLLNDTFPIYKPVDVVIPDEYQKGNIKNISMLNDLAKVRPVVSDTVGIE